jgi:glutathione S-transferase
MTSYPLTTLAVVLALLVFLVLGTLVGAARGKWNVPAPLSSGHPEFDKRYRVQMNTLEQLVLFLPAMYLAAPILGDTITGGIGLVWSLGRILYARAYYADPAKRSLGFALTAFPTLGLILVAGYGAVRTLIG